MTTQYKNTAELLICHSYFDDTEESGILLIPSEDTSKLFKKYGFIFKPIFNGFQLFSTSVQPLDVFFNYIEKANGISAFTIEMIPIDASFYNYTELPENGAKNLTYSTNNSTSKSGMLLLNVSTLSEKSAFNLGTITLNFSDLNENNPSRYLIEYTAQKTQWNYYIINRNKLILNQPYIQTKSEITFESPVAMKLETGEEALLFSSGQNTIPLHSSPLQQFALMDLVERSGNANQPKSKTIFSGLPTPMPSRTKFFEVEGKLQITSPMYVYL